MVSVHVPDVQRNITKIDIHVLISTAGFDSFDRLGKSDPQRYGYTSALVSEAITAKTKTTMLVGSGREHCA